MEKIKIIRTATISVSLNSLLKGQLKFLNEYFNVVAVSGYNEKLEEVQQREGVKIVDIPMSRKINLLQDLKSLFNLYFYFKKEKPTIVHSITPKAGLLTMLAGKLAGVPIRMHTFTGLIFPTYTGVKQKLLIRMDQLLCWAATHVYPEGKGVKNDLSRFKITSKPLKFLPEDYKLLLVGDGARRLILEDLVVTLQLQDRVTFLGLRKDVYPLIKMCDIAILSSHWEGFGLVAVEAMASGIPLIASNVKGLAQVVDGGGLLFEPSNVEDLISKILELNDPNLYMQTVNNCLEKSKNYDINIMIEKLITLYDAK